MQVRNARLERVLKSFGFSLFLFVLWGTLTGFKAAALSVRFEWRELGWVLYNGAIAILFLVRATPSRVSMDPIHWLVALITSFAGLFFRRDGSSIDPPQSTIADGFILSGIALGLVAALELGRSYDFLPALRGVRTRGVYRAVRHPMYLSSIMIRLGYLVMRFSAYNLAIFLVMAYLYGLRARFEEEVMANDERYAGYLAQVRWKFLPGVY